MPVVGVTEKSGFVRVIELIFSTDTPAFVTIPNVFDTVESSRVAGALSSL